MGNPTWPICRLWPNPGPGRPEENMIYEALGSMSCALGTCKKKSLKWKWQECRPWNAMKLSHNKNCVVYVEGTNVHQQIECATLLLLLKRWRGVNRFCPTIQYKAARFELLIFSTSYPSCESKKEIASKLTYPSHFFEFGALQSPWSKQKREVSGLVKCHVLTYTVTILFGKTLGNFKQGTFDLPAAKNWCILLTIFFVRPCRTSSVPVEKCRDLCKKTWNSSKRKQQATPNPQKNGRFLGDFLCVKRKGVKHYALSLSTLIGASSESNPFLHPTQTLPPTSGNFFSLSGCARSLG